MHPFHDEPTDTQPRGARVSDCPAITDADREALACILGGDPSSRDFANAPSLDMLARALTAFPDFASLVFDPGGVSTYRPSIYPDSPAHVRLADAYDRVQAARGDSRRAYRGGA